MQTALISYCSALAIALASLALSMAASASGLRVRSATYAAAPDRVDLVLVNDTQRPITAYAIDITAAENGAVIQHTGFSEDRLALVIIDRQKSGNAGSWVGAIQPGSTYAKSQPGVSMGDGRPADHSAIIQVKVKGLVYADGTVDSDSTDSRRMIQRILDERRAQFEQETVVVASFTRHTGDPSPQQAITSIEQEIAKVGPFARTDVENLQSIQSSQDPKARLAAYTSYVVARHRIRMSLMRPEN